MPSAVVRSGDEKTGAAAVELAGVTRRFGGFVAVDNIDLAVRRGEFFSLLGPSGCGKTTLLRLIAGLDRPDAGTLRIGGRDADGLPAHRRPVNTVFQSYALFPHLTVRENVAFGLRMKRVPAPELDRRVASAMELVEISGLAGRHPGQLSGGQKQRVALARALINEPEVLLLDEPLGALDLKLRKQLQLELHSLQRRLGITFIHVTHDQDEALAMSDRIAVMQAGRIEQIGAGREIYELPRSRFVAQFLGSCNLVEGVVSQVEAGAVRLRTPLGDFEVGRSVASRSPGDRCTVAMRPERAVLTDTQSPPGLNSVAVRVLESIYSGSDTEYSLAGPAGVLLKAQVLNAGLGDSGWRAGDQARVHWPPAALVLLED